MSAIAIETGPGDVWGGQNHSGHTVDDFGGYQTGAADADFDVSRDNKCFGCGQDGHMRAECPNPQAIVCRHCNKEGHMAKECPEKPAMMCNNCGQEGHTRNQCQNARQVNRDHVADTTPEAAWEKLKQAAAERDVDDAKEAVQEYVKSLQGAVTYREIQEALIDQGIKIWLIATERPLNSIFTNMDLQGNVGKKYSVSYRFSNTPERPREMDGWPTSNNEILSRLDDAGEVVDSGKTKCHNCGELGHPAKFCTQEKVERSDRPKIVCSNCNDEGHRVRDCPQPRVDKFACRNCGKPGHKASECEEPPNLDNVECRNCGKNGHFSRDCPDGGSRACRNCGQEGHIAKDCDQPRNMDTVTCRNCEKPGHFSKECPEPTDWSKVKCSNCNEFGHTKVRCKMPPKDSAQVDDACTGIENLEVGNSAPNDAGWGAAGNGTTDLGMFTASDW